ncbi:unnamed protein product [Didymodactylos carnosus]|uniref:Uncharacterized protein n=1 Tax=Didymodactylos carnosus TaxID=1234261 RepID=A0A814QEY7_9BILA|nr:unnamed protein product [Didymodactylos carnosus]CAF3882381.1 unnamed protein product [Didymodactylos carnosus]
MQLEQEKQEKAATDTNTNNELDEAHLTIKKVNKEESCLLKQQIKLQNLMPEQLYQKETEQKIPLNTIVQQPRMEQRDNFSKGLSGGGACLDS